MSRENSFPWSVRLYGLLGLLGIATFMSSLIILHLMGADIDWMRDYVSNLANKPLGWVFIAGTFVHGWGNLALTIGLRGALHPGKLRNWAVLFFGLAAVGIMLTTLFPIEPPGQTPGITGRAHRAIASATFALELAALFVFSAAFRRQRRWHRQQAVSLALSVSAAVCTDGVFYRHTGGYCAGPCGACGPGGFTGLGALDRLSTDPADVGRSCADISVSRRDQSGNGEATLVTKCKGSARLKFAYLINLEYVWI